MDGILKNLLWIQILISHSPPNGGMHFLNIKSFPRIDVVVVFSDSILSAFNDKVLLLALISE